MAAIGSLAVRVSADTQPFNDGMRKTQGPANALKKRMENVAKIAGSMAAALVAAGTATTVALVKKGLEAVDAQAKLSRVLGTTTASVQSMARAAELSGIPVSKMESNLRAYTKRLGEAKEGTGQAADTLEKLGLNAQELSELPLDQQMKLIAERFNGLETAADKAAAASDLFSRAGIDMVNVFDQNGAAIDQARQEIEGFGAAVSDVDAATIERTNDAMSTVGTVVSGIANQLAVKFAPILEVIANKFKNIAMETKGFKGVIESSFGGAVAAVGFFGNTIRGLQIAFKGVELVVNGFGAVVANVIEGIAEGIAITIDTISAGINTVIQGINKIPGVTDIPLLGSVKNFEIFEGIRNLSEQSRIQVIALRSELHNLAMQELPSDQVDKFVQEVTAASQKISEDTIKAREGLANMSTPGAAGDKDKEDKKKKMEEELELIRARLAGEEEEIALSYERQLEKLREFKENELLTTQEFSDLKKQIEAQEAADITALKKRQLELQERQEKRSRQIQVNAAKTAFGDIVSATESNSKKMFRIQKAAAISNAVITGWESAVNAWNAGMSIGTPFAPLFAAAYAAASLAKTGAQIAAIKSQSFGGGGSQQGGGGGGGVPTPTTAGAPAGGGGGGGESRVANITVRGNNFSGDQIAQVATELGNFLSDSNGRMGDSRVRIMREA